MLAFIPGLIKGWAANQAWLCFAILFYFCFAVMASEKPGLPGNLAIAESLAIMVLFIAAMLYGRWQGRADWLSAQTDQTDLVNQSKPTDAHPC